MISPLLGASILSSNTLNCLVTPKDFILSSIRSFTDCLMDFCTSLIHTALVGCSTQVSISISAKKCDLPLPRPPHAPLYLIGSNKGTNTLGVAISRVNNSSLYFLYDRITGLAAVIKLLLISPAKSILHVHVP